MSKAAELKKKGRELIAARGLVFVSSSFEGKADRTATCFVKRGKLIIERHVNLNNDEPLRKAYRTAAAARLLNRECTFQSPDFYEMLTPEQKAQIELDVYGYDYEYVSE